MPRYARKSTSKTFHRKSGYRKKYVRTNKRSIARVHKRINYLSKRVAGECFKYTITPASFSNTTITGGSGSVPNYTASNNSQILYNIVSGTP